VEQQTGQPAGGESQKQQPIQQEQQFGVSSCQYRWFRMVSFTDVPAKKPCPARYPVRANVEYFLKKAGSREAETCFFLSEK
jgi:hypothetical protein